MRLYFTIVCFFLLNLLYGQTRFEIHPDSIKSVYLSGRVIKAGKPHHSVYSGLRSIIPGESYIIKGSGVNKGKSFKTRSPHISKLKIPNTFEPGSEGYKLPSCTIVRYHKEKGDESFYGSIKCQWAEEPLIISDLSPFIEKNAMPARFSDNAATNIKFYDISQGLGNSYIECIAESSDGLLWFGTNGNGITVFDGSKFYSFSVDQGLASNMISDILVDSKQRIWIATYDAGISLIENNKIRSFSSKNGLPTNDIMCLAEDKSGNILIGTYGSGLCIYNDISVLTYGIAQGLSENVATLFVDSNEDIWIGTTRDGMYRWDNKRFYQYSTKQGLYSNDVRSIVRSSDGYLWVGTSKGLQRISGNEVVGYTVDQGFPNNEVRKVYEATDHSLYVGFSQGGLVHFNGSSFSVIGKQHGLNNDEILDVFQDANGVIWCGTFGGGVIRYEGDLFIHLTNEHGLKGRVITALNMDRAGDMYLAGFGYGLIRFNGKEFFHYTKDQGFNATEIWSLIRDKNDVLWIATNNEGLWTFDGADFTCYDQKSGFFCNSIWSLCEASDSTIWMGCSDGSVVTHKDNKFSKYQLSESKELLIDDIVEDHKGNIWVATWGKGVYCINGKEIVNYTTKDGLASDDIYSIYVDDLGNIWFGTNGKGISVLSGDHFTNIGTRDGLTHNIIYWIREREDGQIMIGTENGLTKLSLVTKNKMDEIQDEGTKKIRIFNEIYRVATYGVAQGFTGSDCIGSQYSAINDANGNMWIGTGKQLTKYNPKLERLDTLPPKVHLNKVKIFFQDIFSKEVKQLDPEQSIKYDTVTPFHRVPVGLSLPYSLNHITFEFVGVNWNNPHSVQYQFMLEGYENSWNPLTNQSIATYSQLPPGTFKFKVRAVNTTGYWSEPYSYDFIIRTPWWRTWYFQMGIVVFLLAMAIGLIRLRVSALKQQKERLEEIVRERTAEMFNQKEEIQAQRDKLDASNMELEKLSIVAQETHNGVLIADARGNIEWINQGYTRLLGYTLSAIRERKGPNLFFIYHSENTLDYLKKCRDTKESVTFTSRYETITGDGVWLQTTLTPILRDDGEIKKYVAIYADITELKLAQEQIEKHNKEITSSIRYASRIQSSVLPSKREIRRSDLNSFIIYKSKDIVGGDFYWFSEHEGKYLIAAIDCTGHGVPGAFMTLITYSVMNRVISNATAKDPAFVLQQINRRVKRMLKQNELGDNLSDDGLDASFCYVDPHKKQIRFAGAFQSLFYTENEDIVEIKGDRQSLGYTTSKDDFVYTNHDISIEPQTVCYLMSDGYKDMPFGDRGLPFGKKNLKKKLKKIIPLQLKDQKKQLVDFMDKLHMKHDQRDDITVIGFKIQEFN